jgi:enoyl-CoA hydratase
MRNTPDAAAFIAKASEEGVGAATNERDALFGDYSMAGPDRRPDPSHVIEPG